ncbi:MAG: hypothetical protein WBP41_01550 [Saprospiraceae bacterium]
MKIYSMSIVLFVVLNVTAQSNLKINFGTIEFQITKVDQIEISSGNQVTDDLIFFTEHFKQNDYLKYRDYYYNNSCIASEEDFKNWRSQISNDVITPVARYLINSSEDTLSMIAYTRESSGSRRFFPLALQRKGNKWYLLDKSQSEKLMPMKMFLTFANPGFIDEFLQHPDEMKAKYMASIFTARGQLNGDLMMNTYESRYDPSSPGYNLSQEAFHGIALLPQDFVENISTQMTSLADEYKISPAQTIVLQNMCREGNYNMALSKIAEWSGTPDVIEISDKFHSRINATGNINRH